MYYLNLKDYKHFKIKSMEKVENFPAYKYWLGHLSLGLSIFSVLLIFMLKFNFSLELASIISCIIVFIYIMHEEIVVQSKWKWFSDNPRDSLTDINQTMSIVLPLTLFANGLCITSIIVLIFHILFFYVTVIKDWTHQ